MKGLIKFLGWAFLALIVLGIIGAVFNKKSDKGTTTTVTTSGATDGKASEVANKEEGKKEEAPATTSWQYSQEEDKMSSTVVKFASVNAKELLEFDFPYNGGSTASIVIRGKKGKTDVALQVDKGQFMTGVYGQKITVRFDDEPAFKMTTSRSSTGEATVLFIDNTAKFISSAKKAKKLLVEAEFFNSGSRQMEFPIEGLQWN